jgi:hypothetical protein
MKARSMRVVVFDAERRTRIAHPAAPYSTR